jgi:ribonuclease R
MVKMRAILTTLCIASRYQKGRGQICGQGWRLAGRYCRCQPLCRNGSAIDVDAYERATSVYFPRRVIPMLPEKLSNGLCSLNPEVERLCMVCDMHVTGDGDVEAYQFYPAVMWSHARFHLH